VPQSPAAQINITGFSLGVLDGIGGGMYMEHTLELITISPEYICKDIAEALFGDWGDCGGDGGN